ncbi:PQQ-binding-like beta-propeller repeat protein [Actinoplanes sp. CA-142083]|uniref:outer membrane protein assembly factor BamB family protein n=1 Tax=Actinoplanes sp. CA-142083 TaxID=3239903 RepID=UPI003D8C9505
MTVIDLGEVTHEDAGPAVPLNHRRLLRVLLAVLTVAGVLAVAGSAHGTPPGLRPLWITPLNMENDAVALDGDTAYLARTGVGVGDTPTLAAYNLATGEMRWSTPTGDQLAGYSPRPAGDVVLAPVDPVTVSHNEENGDRYFYITVRTTIALDAATGDELWRVNGDAHPSVPTGTALVAEHDRQNRVVGLRAVKLRDGAELWHLALPPLADWTPLPDFDHPEAIATVTQNGTASVYGFADGKLRKTGRLPWDGEGVVTSIAPTGPNFAVSHDQIASGTMTTVYDSGTFKALWFADYVAPCGALACSSYFDGLSARDPATGRVVWNLPATHDGWQVGADRTLVGADRNNNQLQLVDSRTGKLLGRPVTGMAAPGSGEADSVLVTRPSLDPVGQLVVTRVDLADGRQTPLGRFGPSGDQTVCLSSPGYLACPRYDGLHVMGVDP